MRTHLFSLVLVSIALNSHAAYADQSMTSQPTVQDSSVESFFQIDGRSSKATNDSALPHADSNLKTKNKFSAGKFVYKVFDNIGVPMPLSKASGLAPGLTLKAPSPQSLSTKPIEKNLERIQAPSQDSTENAVPQKIPQSELEGTMYDSSVAPDAKKSDR